jgi:hypothetical protein
VSNASPGYNRDVNVDTQREAIARINVILEEADKALRAALTEAEKLADEHDIELFIEAVDIGLTRDPKLPADWTSSSCSGDDYVVRGEWQSSSSRC